MLDWKVCVVDVQSAIHRPDQVALAVGQVLCTLQVLVFVKR